MFQFLLFQWIIQLQYIISIVILIIGSISDVKSSVFGPLRPFS